MSIFEYERDAVHVRARCVKLSGDEETRKFSVDPNLTSFEILKSILTRAFDLGEHYTICFLSSNEWMPLLSDWDLDAAIISASEPHLNIKISEREQNRTRTDLGFSVLSSAVTNKTGVNFLRKQVEKTLPNITQRFQKALTLAEDSIKAASAAALVPRSPVGDINFQSFLDGVGELNRPRELRLAVYQGGVEPQLRKVVWKHILGVYPSGLNGKQRINYVKAKSKEYHRLKQTWMDIILQGNITEEIKFITNMVRKDVLRTDRQHTFYAGEGNKNVSVLFNVLTTYALNHPSVGYCQGMSDLLSPILVTMQDEAHAYITFCSLMKRLKSNFLPDGKTMTRKFNHLSEGLMYYDPEFYAFLKLNNADDLLFCYRWLLLELKREFAFEDSCRVLEVLWSSLPPIYPDENGLQLFEVQFNACAPTSAPRNIKLTETPYAKMAKLRKRTGSSDAVPGGAPPQSAQFVRTLSSEASRPRIQSAGCAEERIKHEDMKKSLSSDKVKKVRDLQDFYKLTGDEASSTTKTPTPPPPPAPSAVPKSPVLPEEAEESSSSVNKETTVVESDPFDANAVGYSQANGNTISMVCNRLPPPTEYGDGNPFLMFLCLSIIMQHRSHVMQQKFDYQEIAMYFDRMIRSHNAEKTLHIARKLFAEYLNEDWAMEDDSKNENMNSC